MSQQVQAEYAVEPIGYVRSSLTSRDEAPMQGFEGAPDAWLEIKEEYRDGLEGIRINQEIILVTWFHLARRDVLRLHPRQDEKNPLSGVFATRSPDRPNPVALHRVAVREISGSGLRVGPLEAVDGTPIVDIKPVLKESEDA
jgi:tRNA-Thr(GGU) m(6)t(6)A37 methyltransferase TsaA